MCQAGARNLRVDSLSLRDPIARRMKKEVIPLLVKRMESLGPRQLSEWNFYCHVRDALIEGNLADVAKTFAEMLKISEHRGSFC